MVEIEEVIDDDGGAAAADEEQEEVPRAWVDDDEEHDGYDSETSDFLESLARIDDALDRAKIPNADYDRQVQALLKSVRPCCCC